MSGRSFRLLRSALCLVFFAVGLLLWCPARAQSGGSEELARQHHDRGTSHYNLGQFEDAIAEYRRGYEQRADPVFLFNIAQSYRQLGAQEKALFFYRRYLSTYPAALNRHLVEERVAELVPRVEREAVAGESADRRNGVADRTDLDHPMALSSSKPALVAPGLDVDAATALPPVPGPVWQRWWFWGAVGTVVLGSVATALVLSRSGSDSATATDLGHKRFF